MTDEQINIAIAESLGLWYIPNYTSDLNACHEFEKTLSDGDYNKYYRHLSTACLRDFENGIHFSADPISATARQRCEAYLRTLGKWIE